MLEQIVTNESVLEDEAAEEEEQKVLENEEQQEQQRQHQALQGSLSTGASPQR